MNTKLHITKLKLYTCNTKHVIICCIFQMPKRRWWSLPVTKDEDGNRYTLLNDFVTWLKTNRLECDKISDIRKHNIQKEISKYKDGLKTLNSELYISVKISFQILHQPFQ